MTQKSFDEIDAAWRTIQPAAPGAEGGFSRIPAGTEVKVAISDQKFARVGQHETPVVKVIFDVMEPEEYNTSKIWHDLWLTEKNLPYLKRDLDLLGWKKDVLPDQVRLSDLMNPSDFSLMALGAVVVVDIEEYTDKHGQSKEKNIIKFFKEPWTPVVDNQTEGAGDHKAPVPF